MTSEGKKSRNSKISGDNCIIESSDTSCCSKCAARMISLCGTLNDNNIHHFAKISTQHIKLPKQTICREGDETEYLYNIRSGCVLISKMLADGRRQIIDFLFVGDFFGFTFSSGYNYTAEAVTDVDLCILPIQKLYNKMNDFPELGRKMLEITRSELQISQDQILLLGRKKAKEKLCSFILSMSNKTTQINNLPKNTAYLPMSRSDVADYLGLTIETVSRQFTMLTKDNIISLKENPYVTILDKNRMILIASGQ